MPAQKHTAKRAGVMGWPIEHSLSPRLHGFWLKHYKIDGSYEALAVKPEELERALKDLPAQGFCGVNLTVPHKEAALKIVDHLEPLARDIGAINTVVVRADGSLEGRNTDAYGFEQSLLAAGVVPNFLTKVAILGAGGAARAVVMALHAMGFPEINLINRTREHSEALQHLLGGPIRLFDWNDYAQAFKGVSLLVNATSLGLRGQPPLDVALDTLSPTAWVTDLVYAPLETDLLKRAKDRGNKTIDGLGMLLHQARPAFHAFFGRDPEVTDALRAFVLGKQA